MSTEPDDEEEDEVETAFTGSDKHVIGKAELMPYTPSRIVAAQSMGLHYGLLTDDEAKQYVEKGIYPQIAYDVTIVLWLCSLKGDAEVARAARWPEAAFKTAAEWGSEQGTIYRDDQRFWDALGTFEKIMAEVKASRAKLAGQGDSPPKQKRRSRPTGPNTSR